MAEPDGAAPAETRLADLRPGQEEGVLTVRLLSADRREVARRDDARKVAVLSGWLSDGSAPLRYTWWEPPPENIERGTVLRVVRFAVRSFRGRTELTFNARTRVEEASPLELADPAGAQLPLRALADLTEGAEGFRVRARVLRVSPKSVLVNGARRDIFEGTLADTSGAIAFSAWSDFGLRAGEAVEVGLGRVSTYRGVRQFVFDARGTVDRVASDSLPPLSELAAWPLRTLTELATRGGSDRCEARGTVIWLLPPSGLVYRCPTCSRAVEHGACRIHGTVTGVPDLRARVVLDDGGAAATVSLGRPDAERLGGRSLDDHLRELDRVPDPQRVEEALFDSLFGRTLRVRGSAVVDDYGLSLLPEEVVEVGAGPVVERRPEPGGGT